MSMPCSRSTFSLKTSEKNPRESMCRTGLMSFTSAISVSTICMVIFPPLPLTRCVRLTPTHKRGAVISHKLFPCLPLAPPQLDRIEEINVDAHGRLGKFGLHTEF